MKNRFWTGSLAIPAFSAGLRLALAVTGVIAWMAPAPSSIAHDLRHGKIHIGHAWTRPAQTGGTAEVYFAVVNRGAEADRLVSARTPAAARATLAETQGELTVAHASIELGPSRPVALRPGRLHVRLEGLARELRLGDQLTLTLVFAEAPPADVTVIVEAAPGH
jgi:copper(I)-binding protein